MTSSPHPRLFGLWGPQLIRISYCHAKCFPRSLGPGAGERKGNNHLVARVGSTQPSTAYGPTKSPDVGWLGIIVVREHRVGR